MSDPTNIPEAAMDSLEVRIIRATLTRMQNCCCRLGVNTEKGGHMTERGTLRRDGQNADAYQLKPMRISPSV